MRRIAATAAAALMGTLALAPAAPAASRLVVKGHGYGHGIGMSQYGALGYAQHGTGYQDILGHYYEQTSLAPLGTRPDVRVLLQSARRAVVSGVVAGAGRKLHAGSTYVVRNRGGRLVLYSPAGRRLGSGDSPLRLAAARDGAFTLRGAAANGTRNGRYRGALEVRASGAGVQAINAVDLEDYVRGVVSAESPSSWPAEALKAQAVAARTYAVTTDAGTPADGFDQFADTRSQMYKGVAAELPSTDAAVAATKGQVVVQNGQPVTTYFFSTSGGHTEDIQNSFVGALPRAWLRGVDDPFDGVSPRHSWGPYTFSQSRAQARLKGLVRGSFRGITVLERGVSPRIVRAEIDGTNGVTQVTGPQLRARLGLFDTWATFTYISSNADKKHKAKQPSGADGTTPAGDDGTGGSTSPAGAPPADTTGGQAAAIARVALPKLSGTIRPARRGRRLAVQRRDGRTWRTVGTTRVGRAGRYRATLPGPGTYRVALGDVTGPAVDVR